MTNKLLSDDELIEEIGVITDNLLAYGVGAKDSYDTRIFDLINTQKRLYAESVIGENESAYSEDGSRYFEHIYHQNTLRDKQRDKIK